MTERKRTGFVVKAANASGLEMWISVPRHGGHRVFGPRENADVFKTKLEANAAISKMPTAFGHAGFTFTVDASE